ncbi:MULTISPECIES: AI-2E family transporter [Niastella]|uniref:AI-2E family transporter n=1 Tax=Niastella soli TaxID=2821487 RepID=A0ABS3YYT8_9BACT|nr:AI-2E family transporter [Niastella soli]MBO9203092.1 AI-2E family transporter [Niastella soli]
MQSPNLKEVPFYFKATIILIALVLFFYILKSVAEVLIPFAFAGLIAILFNPLFNRLNRIMPRIPAILLTLLIATLILAGLIYLLSNQIAKFGESMPLVKQKFSALLTKFQTWIQHTLGFSIQKHINVIREKLTGAATPGVLTNTLGSILGMVGVIVLLPIYVFLLLFYKPLILNFLFEVFAEKHSVQVAEVLGEVKSAIQSFMLGLMIETAIVCTLNSIALMIIGVPNAIVIGVIGGILNILPYIGGVIAILLPVLMSLISQDSFSPILAIVISYTVIQFIDNNFLVPKIVSSKVQINALISIIVVLLGGLLWGFPGMFLSIPFIAILKIIFDRIEGLKPWGKLLGDDVPTEHIGIIWQKRWNRILRRTEKEKIEG